ncbi:MAG: hypothetical protein K2Y39_22145 [Candidatus Obscuribacterales bacterium]|nr:hypothetical protein [Candidatus Obscuribacterales bacterium]
MNTITLSIPTEFALILMSFATIFITKIGVSILYMMQRGENSLVGFIMLGATVMRVFVSFAAAAVIGILAANYGWSWTFVFGVSAAVGVVGAHIPFVRG